MRLLNYAAALFVLSIGLTAAAQSPQVGDKVPAILSIDQDGKPWVFKLDPEKKKYTVIYFYPGALSGSCVKQVSSFRDRDETKIDMDVIGISGDTPASLKIFQQAYNLNFTLLSDPDGAAAKLFGVPVQPGKRTITRQVDGKSVTLERSVTLTQWVFILDREGKIIYRNTDVRADVDLNMVVEFIRKTEG